MMDFQICKRLVLAITLGSLLFSIPTFAKPGSAPGGHMQINEVFWVEGSPDTLVISGFDFDFGDGELVVTLGAEGVLAINSATATEIEVVIPALPAGDYLLSVFRQGGQSQGDEYDLTIGAVGPDGAGCTITECVQPGEATLTCGATSVTVPCVVICPIDWEQEKELDSWTAVSTGLSCIATQTAVFDMAAQDSLEIFRCPGSLLCANCSDGGARIVVNDDQMVCLSVDEQIACSQSLIEYMKLIPLDNMQNGDPATCSPVEP